MCFSQFLQIQNSLCFQKMAQAGYRLEDLKTACTSTERILCRPETPIFNLQKNICFFSLVPLKFSFRHCFAFLHKGNFILMLAWCQELHELKSVLRFTVSLPDHSVWIFKVSLKNLNVRSFVGLPFQYIDRILLN